MVPRSFLQEAVMAAIIDFPTIVQDALRDFSDLLPNEPQRRHFAEYLTGLFVADRKNVSGINREFAQTTDQSCLNRFATAADWDVGQLNQRRLAFLQEEPSTRYSTQGVIPIDNTLVDHYGQLIADVGWFWDHAEERYKVAHDYRSSTTSAPPASTTPWISAASRRKTCARPWRSRSRTTPLCARS